MAKKGQGRKFTDDELTELHKRGVGLTEASNILEVDRKTVYEHGIRLGLRFGKKDNPNRPYAVKELVCELCQKVFFSPPAEPEARHCSRECYDKNRSTPAQERFWPKVSVREDGGTSCWIWTANKNNKGYGLFAANGTIILAHRFSYELSNGPIPAGLHIMHTCDNPACVNPHHLRAGTAKENMQDMIAKGRNYHKTHPEKILRGEKHGNAELTLDEVEQIRARYASGEASVSELAKEFNKSDSHISRIIQGKSWRLVSK